MSNKLEKYINCITILNDNLKKNQTSTLNWLEWIFVLSLMIVKIITIWKLKKYFQINYLYNLLATNVLITICNLYYECMNIQYVFGLFYFICCLKTNTGEY